ncbi:ATP-binding protein [Methanolobus sp. WCC4]|uniref:sensor histidine kinase n=1 Tax=Methanolobus sp. WCC4 TaxID=3125784 RepID=UPI0030FBB063
MLFRKAVEYSSLSLLILDGNYEPVYMNHKFTEIFGYTLEDIPSMEELWKLSCPDVECKKNAFCLWGIGDKSDDDGSVADPGEWIIQCKDGSVKDIELNSTKISSDRTIIILKDITEMKCAEKALLLDELRLEALLELNRFTGSTVDDVMNFVLEKAVELTESQIGYVGFVSEKDSVVDMYAWSKGSMKLCSIDDPVKTYHFEEMGLWGEPIRQRTVIITNDYANTTNFKRGVPEGHIDILRHLGIPILDNGKVVMVAGVGNKAADYNSSDVRQITLLMEGTWKLIQGKQNEAKIKAYAEQLSRTNKELESLDRMKDEFMANITHELKTPLIPIKGYSELLFEGHLGTLDEDQKRSMGMILQNASRLEKLIDSLLYMQNIHSGNIQYHLDSIDIVSLLDRVIDEIDPFKGEESPSLHREYNSSLPYICGNSTYLEQVFSHILENAFKFTPSDGMITVSSSMEDKMIRVTVKDTGIGISGEEMPHIFKRFYQADGSLTRRYGGNGLGLYLCKSIVEAHGGSIWAESEAGKGAELHVLLPVIEDE